MPAQPGVHARDDLGGQASRGPPLGEKPGLHLEEAVVAVREDPPGEVGAGLALEPLEDRDVQVGRLVPVEPSVEPVDGDPKLPERRDRVEPARTERAT